MCARGETVPERGAGSQASPQCPQAPGGCFLGCVCSWGRQPASSGLPCTGMLGATGEDSPLLGVEWQEEDPPWRLEAGWARELEGMPRAKVPSRKCQAPGGSRCESPWRWGRHPRPCRTPHVHPQGIDERASKLTRHTEKATCAGSKRNRSTLRRMESVNRCAHYV